MQTIEPEKVSDDLKYIFYDIETYQITNCIHQPMLIIAQYSDGTEFRFPPDEVSMNGYDALVAFGQCLFTDRHKGYTVFAQNNRGYDGYFIMAHLLEHACKAPSVIYRSTQLLNMEYESLKLKFQTC